MNIEITNAFVVTADDNGTVYQNGAVQIAENTITYAGTMCGRPDFKADRVIDAAGDIVMPGFHNTHTHLPMTLLRGCAEDLPLMDWLNTAIFPREDKMTPDDAYFGTLLCLIEMVKAGNVSVSDMYMFTPEILAALRVSGMKGLIARGLLGSSLEDAAQRLDDSEWLFENITENDLVRPAYNLYTEYTCCTELICEVAKRAAEKGARIHAHVSESEWEHNDCIERRGETPIETFARYGAMDVPFMAAHCVYATDDDIKLMAEKGAHVLTCPRSNLKLANGVAPIAKMLAMGVNVAVGTDGAASSNFQSALGEAQLAALLQKGFCHDSTLITVNDAIRLATANGAKALGFDDSGVLKQGNKADLVIIDTSDSRFYPRENMLTHIIYSAYPTDVKLTMIEGRILYEDGQILFADEAQVKAECAKRFARFY